jgi:hypothetical protein
MASRARSLSPAPWVAPPAMVRSSSEIARVVRADLAMELARRGLRARVDVVGESERPEIDVRPQSGRRYHFRLPLTEEAPTTQVPRLLDQVLGRGCALAAGAEGPDGPSSPERWCAPE